MLKLPKQYIAIIKNKPVIKQPKKIRFKKNASLKKEAFIGALAGTFGKALVGDLAKKTSKKLLGGNDDSLMQTYKSKMQIVAQSAPYHGSISAMKREMVPLMQKKFPELDKSKLEKYIVDIYRIAPFIFVSPAVVESALKRVVTYDGIDVAFAKELAAANQNIMKQYVLV